MVLVEVSRKFLRNGHFWEKLRLPTAKKVIFLGKWPPFEKSVDKFVINRQIQYMGFLLRRRRPWKNLVFGKSFEHPPEALSPLFLGTTLGKISQISPCFVPQKQYLSLYIVYDQRFEDIYDIVSSEKRQFHVTIIIHVSNCNKKMDIRDILGSVVPAPLLKKFRNFGKCVEISKLKTSPNI